MGGWSSSRCVCVRAMSKAQPPSPVLSVIGDSPFPIWVGEIELQISCLLLASKAAVALSSRHSCGNEKIQE